MCWRYGRIFRYLREDGMLIGTNDLWIAATALVNDLPFVSRNVGEFRRIPERRVIEYGKGQDARTRLQGRRRHTAVVDCTP